jgi:malonyl CoA-acyl carrier protein transacylase
MKFGLLFPGQGSQFVGMAKDFYDNSDKAKEMFEMQVMQLIKILQNLCLKKMIN